MKNHICRSGRQITGDFDETVFVSSEYFDGLKKSAAYTNVGRFV